MANTITIKDGREIVLSPKAATVLGQCPNWALVRFLIGFTIISLPTISLDDVPTVDKSLPYIQAHIQVQLSAKGQHQNSHHPVEQIHSNVSCPQWPLQKERMKSFAICCWNKTFKWSSLDRAGFVCLVGHPPLLHKWECCGSRNHPSSPGPALWAQITQRHTGIYTDHRGYLGLSRVPFTPVCVMTSSGKHMHLGGKRLTSRKRDWDPALFSLQWNTCSKGLDTRATDRNPSTLQGHWDRSGCPRRVRLRGGMLSGQERGIMALPNK